MSAIDATDRRVLNRLQEDLPLCQQPFAPLATELELSEGDLISRIDHMRRAGIITRFGPFFDAEAIGGAFCLCAIAVPEHRFETVAEQVNAHPEVAHNYARDHRLNMWFVLATEDKAGIAVLRFPKLREFFIGFRVAA